MSSIVRTEPESGMDERTTLVAFLHYQRQTLEIKTTGLDAADLARRSVEPSSMSLLGLVRHMADVERIWFRRTLAGMHDDPPLYFSAADPDGEFDNAAPDPALVEDAWRSWRAEVEFAEKFVEDAPSLDLNGQDRHGERRSLRWVLVHMIEEYARHNGHADLLRERIDGAVGE